MICRNTILQAKTNANYLPMGRVLNNLQAFVAAAVAASTDKRPEHVTNSTVHFVRKLQALVAGHNARKNPNWLRDLFTKCKSWVAQWIAVWVSPDWQAVVNGCGNTESQVDVKELGGGGGARGFVTRILFMVFIVALMSFTHIVIADSTMFDLLTTELRSAVVLGDPAEMTDLVTHISTIPLNTWISTAAPYAMNNLVSSFVSFVRERRLRRLLEAEEMKNDLAVVLKEHSTVTSFEERATNAVERATGRMQEELTQMMTQESESTRGLVSSEGKTTREVLLERLRLMETRMDEIHALVGDIQASTKANFNTVLDGEASALELSTMLMVQLDEVRKLCITR